MPMTVEDVARRSGVAANTIRYYTRIGLLQPHRHPSNGYRLFDESDLRQLGFIVEAKQLGFSLAEIGRLIETSKRGAPTGTLAKRIVERRVVQIRSQIVALRDLQHRMESALHVWDRVPEHAPEGPSICSFIEMVSTAVRALDQSPMGKIGIGTARRWRRDAEAHVSD